MKTTAFLLLTMLAGVLPVRMAFATHKSWVLKNSAADCSFDNPGSDESSDGVLTNDTTASRTAICPVALSGRWGSSSDSVFPPGVSARAMSALVYIDDPGNGVVPNCYVAMQSTNMAFYFSASFSGSGPPGPKKIVVASQNNWGGLLEANEQLWARSIDFHCSVPAGGSIYAYKVKMCPADGLGTCNDMYSDHDTAGIDDNRAGNVWIQTSGFECSPQGPWDAPNLRRTFDGIRNTSTGDAGVFCPITLPADDSYEHQRILTDTAVHYKGGSKSATCVLDRTCPDCYLRWWNRLASGVPSNSSSGNEFMIDISLGLSFVHNISQDLGYDVQVGVECILPAGVTLNGIVSKATVTRVQTGLL